MKGKFRSDETNDRNPFAFDLSTRRASVSRSDSLLMIPRVHIELPFLSMRSGWPPFKEPDRDYRDHLPIVDSFVNGTVRDSFTPTRSELSPGWSS